LKKKTHTKKNKKKHPRDGLFTRLPSLPSVDADVKFPNVSGSSAQHLSDKDRHGNEACWLIHKCWFLFGKDYQTPLPASQANTARRTDENLCRELKIKSVCGKKNILLRNIRITLLVLNCATAHLWHEAFIVLPVFKAITNTVILLQLMLLLVSLNQLTF
jgi:hypothetical protein